MDRGADRYSRFALVREMLETAEVVRRLNSTAISDRTVDRGRVFVAGEGSSRIFPAQKLVTDAMRHAYHGHFCTEYCAQARQYQLDDWAVFAASNSGRTAEAVGLLRSLRERNHSRTTAITVHENSPLVEVAHDSYILTCGAEQAVAATKSVVEQTLFYDILFRCLNGQPSLDLQQLGDAIEEVLRMPIPSEIASAMVAAPIIYFAGRNDGVAEELALKTNEITRRKSDFLPGTYALHGIEEVMNNNEIVVLVDPFAEEEETFDTVLRGGVGLPVVAIASRQTRFPTLVIPAMGDTTPYLQLAAGWNMLVETGIALGIDLDHPQRARKIGNETRQ